MTIQVVRATVIGILLILAGCGTNVIVPNDELTEEHFIGVYKFSPFNPPRDADGVGTVITFDDNGQESIVYRASSCIDPASVHASIANVAIPNRQYNITSKNVLEWDLSAKMGFNLNLTGIVKGDEVVRVKFRLVNPTVTSIEMGTTRRFIASLDEDTCLSELLNSRNLIVHSVLSAEAIEYTFTDEYNNRIDVQAKLVGEEGAQVTRDVSFSEDKAIVLNKKMFFGYRAWFALELSGLLGDRVDLERLTVTEVEAMRGSRALGNE